MRWQRVGVGCGLGVACYALALVALAPATLLDAQLQSASNGRLRLVEAQGSVWSGSGRIELRDPGRGTAMSQAATWRWQPGELALAKLAFSVAIGSGGRPFPLTLSPTQIEIADADIRWPASSLSLAMAMLEPFGLTGEFRFTVAKIEIALAPGAANGSATLRWHGAGSSLSPQSPLGDYELRLTGNGDAVSAVLHTLAGPLQLEGAGSSTRSHPPAFQVTARMTPALHERLAPFLRLIAVDRGDGSFELRRP